jgi:hypothetical protein
MSLLDSSEQLYPLVVAVQKAVGNRPCNKTVRRWCIGQMRKTSVEAVVRFFKVLSEDEATPIIEKPKQMTQAQVKSRLKAHFGKAVK